MPNRSYETMSPDSYVVAIKATSLTAAATAYRGAIVPMSAPQSPSACALYFFNTVSANYNSGFAQLRSTAGSIQPDLGSGQGVMGDMLTLS